jgi:hypothetical protein
LRRLGIHGCVIPTVATTLVLWSPADYSDTWFKYLADVHVTAGTCSIRPSKMIDVDEDDARRHHSRLGVASVLVGLMSAVLTGAPFVAIWCGLNPRGSMDHEPTMRFLAFCLVSSAAGIALALVGIAFAMVGLFQKRQGRLFPVVGLLLNALIIILFGLAI